MLILAQNLVAQLPWLLLSMETILIENGTSKLHKFHVEQRIRMMNVLGVIQKPRGQDGVGRWLVKCPSLSM